MQEDKTKGPHFKTNLGYIVRQCLKKKIKINKTQCLVANPLQLHCSTVKPVSQNKLANIHKSVWETPYYVFRASTTVLITVAL